MERHALVTHRVNTLGINRLLILSDAALCVWPLGSILLQGDKRNRNYNQVVPFCSDSSSRYHLAFLRTRGWRLWTSAETLRA